MQPSLGPAYPPDYEAHPIQMSSNDRVVWEYFRHQFPDDFLRLYFDVTVGIPIMWSEGLEEDMIRLVNHISRRRIDVVAETETAWYLIELRMMAGPGAIGSILTYRCLWNQDPPDDRPVNLIIATDYKDENLIYAAGELGIHMIVL